MDRSYLKSQSPTYTSLFYVISLFAITFLMIHFIQFNSDKKIPDAKNFLAVAAEDNDEPLKKPLPPYDYNSLPFCDLSKEIKNPKIDLKEVQKSFLKCVFPLLTRFFGNPEGLLFNFNTVLSVCDDEKSIRDIEIRDFGTQTWSVFPNCKENNTLVTLGVGNDTSAEVWLKKKIPNLEMYGTSGLIESSSTYSNFQNIALGGKGDNLVMEVLENDKLINKSMLAKRFEDYMTEIKLTKIDTLWINTYYGIFPFWDYLKQDGWLNKNGITVCQMIIEVPKGHGEQWTEMIRPMQQNSQFVFMKPTTTKNGGARAFFINYKDPKCTRKYLE
ncbi:unnamed protein product [Caenorhabditis brenneri]